MVKHNNVVPNVHLHKWWQRHVRTWFDQPARKKRRRLARQEKVAKNGLRPLGLLRPIVHPPTQRYNMKLREGRGFTREELKAAGLGLKFARTVGVAVDHRRRNRSEESLDLNAKRLKEYMSRLVVFPRKGTKAKKGFGGMPDDTLLKDVQDKLAVSGGKSIQLLMPVPKPNKKAVFRAITDQERTSEAYNTLQSARKAARKKKTEE